MDKKLKISLITVISIISAIIFFKIAFTIYLTIMMNKGVAPENINFNADKNYKTEITRLKKEIQINPYDTNLKVALSTAYWATGDIPNAMKTIDTFEDPKLEAYNKTVMYFQQKDYDNALKNANEYFAIKKEGKCDKDCQFGNLTSIAIKTNTNWQLKNYTQWVFDELKLFWILLIHGKI